MDWRDSQGGKNFLASVSRYNCGQCGKIFDQPWVVPTNKPYPNNIQPNVEVAFHWADTHGFPEDMCYRIVMGMVWGKFPRELAGAE